MQELKVPLRTRFWIRAIILLTVSCPIGVSGQLHPSVSSGDRVPASRADVAKLLRAIDQSDRVEVFSMNGLSLGDRMYASEAHKDLEALKVSLTHIAPSGLCACAPTVVIKLFRRDKVMGELAVMEGDIVSFSSWTGDGRVARTQPWFDWLDARGIKGPRKQFELEHSSAGAQDR
jgi:hypothetical protein